MHALLTMPQKEEIFLPIKNASEDINSRSAGTAKSTNDLGNRLAQLRSEASFQRDKIAGILIGEDEISSASRNSRSSVPQFPDSAAEAMSSVNYLRIPPISNVTGVGQLGRNSWGLSSNDQHGELTAASSSKSSTSPKVVAASLAYLATKIIGSSLPPDVQDALINSPPSSVAEARSLMLLMQSQPRRRGRPRKRPYSSSETSCMPPTRKPRGRPRKYGKPQSSSDYFFQAASHSPPNYSLPQYPKLLIPTNKHQNNRYCPYTYEQTPRFNYNGGITREDFLTGEGGNHNGYPM